MGGKGPAQTKTNENLAHHLDEEEPQHIDDEEMEIEPMVIRKDDEMN